MISPLLNRAYRITSGYGMRTLGGVTAMHAGIDLVPADGVHPTELFATASGIVEDVRNNVPNTHTGVGVTTMVTGNYINIRTADGYLLIYRHLKCGSIPFTKGQKVNEGSFVGVMYTTGQSTGIHLHYEIRSPQNESLDPLQYLVGTKSIGGGPVTDAKPTATAQTTAKVQVNSQGSTAYGTSSVMFNVGDKVKILSTAKNYTGASPDTPIPDRYKGIPLTIMQVSKDGKSVLIKELYSWVWISDLTK